MIDTHMLNRWRPVCRQHTRPAMILCIGCGGLVPQMEGPTHRYVECDLDHTPFHDECGYAPLTLDQGFARVFGGGEAIR